MDSLFNDFFLPLAKLVGFLLLGFFLGKSRILRGDWIGRSLSLVLYFLLFVMGWRTGVIDDIASDLGTMGLTALLFALASLAGSWLLVLGAQILGLKPLPVHKNPTDTMEVTEKASVALRLWNILKGPLILAAIVAAGGLFGFFGPQGIRINLDDLAANLVLLLVFFVGLQTGGSDLDWGRLFGKKSTYILPLITAAGSLAGGALLALALQDSLGLRPGDGAAVTGGFGWYSLSSIILSAQLDAPVLGTIAFLSNIIRESLSFFFIPLLARLGQSNLAISSGGATTMDVTLPLIEKSAGPEAVVPALAHGILLSLAVPFVVPLVFGMGN